MKPPANNTFSQSQFLINQLPFTHAKENITVGLSSEPAPGWYRIHYRALPETVQSMFPDCNEKNPMLYMEFNPSDAEVKVQIPLSQHPSVSRKYYSWILFHHFLKQKTVVRTNFIGTLEVWVRHPKNSEGLYPLARYSLKVNIHEAKPTLRVVFEGFSYIQGMSLIQLNEILPDAVEHVKQVVFERQVYPMGKLPPKGLMNRSQVFPILNRRLASAQGIVYPFRRDLKKHSTYLSMIGDFANKYLHSDGLLKQVPFSSHWLQLDEKDVFRLDNTDKSFLFANQQPATDIQTGLLNHGPYRPLPQKQIRIFFLFHESDAAVRKRVFSYLNGSNGGNGLSRFTKTPTYFDGAMDIIFFNKEDPLPEILPAVSDLSLDPETGYLGIYLSLYDKTVSQAEKHRIYYLVKEALLQRNIAPQTIDTRRMMRAGASFRLWIPNLAMAATAKLGGVPWILNNNQNHDLVVGFGLYHTKKYNLRIVGSSVCFSENGLFEEFDFFPENENYRVAASLEKAILRYVSSHRTINRLVIHYYKEISNKAFQPIREMIQQLQPGIPVIVIRINSTPSEFTVIQNTGSPAGLPLDGSYFHLGSNRYVFYINDYETTEKPPDRLPMPVQLGFKSSDPELLNDPATIQGLMQQVYLFSKLYWRSLRQPAVPVTVSYPKMLAGNAVWFKRQTLPNGVMGVPWFL